MTNIQTKEHLLGLLGPFPSETLLLNSQKITNITPNWYLKSLFCNKFSLS